ncbi:MAG: hypothetical protein ACK44P_02850 [Bacteroidota bacterium]
MKKHLSHIALALFVIFQITLLPFNALHQHAEDEHLASLLHNETMENHHCDLDDLFCQPGVGYHCEHGNHLQRETAKCFTCQFHFVSSIVLRHDYSSFINIAAAVEFKPYFCLAHTGAKVLLLNKGPPQA